MNRILFGLLVVSFASATSANECVDARGQDIFTQPEVFTRLIQEAPSCYQASKIAEACAYGSSLDVQTAGAAYTVCERELQNQKPPEVMLTLLSGMNGLCSVKYETESGTMYRSMEAFCRLSAIQWILGLATPN